MGGLGTLTNPNFHLLDSGQMNHVTSGPTVYGNMDRVVTIKWIQVGRLAYLDSQCSGGGLLSSRHTLENVIVLTWLRLVHPDLPKLVKQRYGTELALAHLPPSRLRSCKRANLCWMKSMPVKMLK